VGGRAGPGVGARCLARETTGGLREADGGAEAVREVDGFVVGAGGVRFPAHEVASAVVGGLVRDPVRGPMITELFERRRDGEPLADLARWLAERDGRPCAPTVVSKLLRNPAYVGEAVMHRYERERATGRVVGREELARRPENHLPLTTETTFRLVQRARGVTRPRATRAREAWLLTGFVRCAGCRYLLRADHNGRGFRTYICKGHHGMGGCAAPAYAGAEALEEYVLRAVLSIDGGHVLPATRSAELEAGRARVEGLREEVMRLVTQLRRSRHPELVQAELEHAEDELEEAESHVADIEEREAGRGVSARSLASLLEKGTEAEKRAVVAAYLDRVVQRRGAEPLADRVLLVLRGEERRFEPLPGRGRKVALTPWPDFRQNGHAAVEAAGTGEQAG
jgi:site-specific DNA recombinase